MTKKFAPLVGENPGRASGVCNLFRKSERPQFAHVTRQRMTPLTARDFADALNNLNDSRFVPSRLPILLDRHLPRLFGLSLWEGISGGRDRRRRLRGRWRYFALGLGFGGWRFRLAWPGSDDSFGVLSAHAFAHG